MTTGNKALLGLVFLLASCNDEAKTSSAEPNADSITTGKGKVADIAAAGCYTQVLERDTASLQIETKGNRITGSLTYNIYGKDRNDGTIQADRIGDIIRGWYLFKSEGIISVREVAWKINGEELWPGIGEVTQRKDTTLFVQPDRLQYDSSRPFKKVPCIA